MKKSLFLVLWSLILVSGLCGDFSINESPSGHVYNPSYTQAESYTIIPITESSITIYPDNHDSTINATTIYSTDGAVPFTIESLLLALRFEIQVDGVKISNMVGSGWDICFTHNLSYGDHSITIGWEELDGASYSNSFDFLVIPYNYYFQNSWSKLYPYSNGSLSFGAVRPALFVEGFSIPDLISGNAWTIARKWDSSMSSSKRYILTFSDPFDHVQDNAMVVLGALRFIHNSQTTPLVEGTSVYGYSMGGILARYALAYAEQWDIQHFCTQYVSIDSPHRGATINLNLQNTMQSLENALDDYNMSDERLDAALSALNSPAAKQLIRENKNADNNSYNAGSNQYRSLFAEINEEDNLINELLDGDPMSILNANPDSHEGVLKPGFPYKQNNIKSYAYSNGGLGVSGNVTNNPIAASWSLKVAVFPNYSGQAAKCEYDRQPGSVLEDSSTSRSVPWLYDFEFTQNYAPVLVPTRSSLYLKRNSISGGTPIPEFDININYLSSLTTNSNYLLDHTYFDQIVYAQEVPFPITEAPLYWVDENGNEIEIIIPHKAQFNEWNWRHGELGWSHYNFDDWVTTNINTSAHWLNQIENRTVCTISGQVNGSDISNIAGMMFINGQGHGSFSIDQNGFYSIPYLYTKDATVRLVFEQPGCMPSYRDININYSNAMLHDQIVPNATMYTLNLNDIRVSRAGNGSFCTINQAIDFVQSFVDSGLYAGEPIRIRVFPETYNESINLVPLVTAGISNFTLEGVGDVTISGEANGVGISLDLSASNIPQLPNANYAIKNLEITGFRRGIVFLVESKNALGLPYTPNLKLHISNCELVDCASASFDGNFYSAAAIHFEGAGSITSCHFLNNSISAAAEYSQFSQAGGVFIRNNTTSTIEVKYNEFTNNVGGLSGGLVATGTGPIRITNDNKFFGNTYGGYGSIANAQSANALSVYDASNIILKNNLFVDNIPSLIPYGAVIGLTTYVSQAATPIRFINNTIVNTPQYNTNGLSAIKFRINAGVTVQDIQIKNNIISSTNSNGCTIDSNAGYSPVSINYNILHNTSLSGFTASLYNPNDPNSVYNPSAPLFNYQTDPELDTNYYPIWNTNTKSYCIDNGNPDLNSNGMPWYLDPEDQDSDDTRMDIGAYHNLDQHINGFHRLNNYEVKYISIPGVENHPGNQGRNTLQYVFGEYSSNDLFNNTNPILESISWIYNSNTGVATPDDTPLHYVHSQNGYKVKLLFGEPLEKDIVYSGFYPGYNLNYGMFHPELDDYSTKHFITAPDQLDGICEIDPNTGVWFRKTYLGYYLPESLKPFDALLPILDDIKAVMAEDWALVRIPIFGYDPQPGDTPSAYYTDLWLGTYLMNNENLAINHGEMVEVHYIGADDVEFKLGGDNPTPPFVETYTRDMTKHFYFEEQLGYIPVFISMDLNQYEDGNKPTEVALFIDEECKGAAVIKDGEIQLNAYITNSDDLSDDLKEVEFRLYFPAKSASSTVTEYAVFNMQTGVYESKTAKVSDFKGFLRVQLTKTGEIPPPAATQLFQNYPNPFNPLTSIKYDLAENSRVRMDIYNVKGQLVKTLLNQEMLAGTHSVIWDGNNDKGRAVSSGVYFYRMTMPNKVLTNKMLLLKWHQMINGGWCATPMFTSKDMK